MGASLAPHLEELTGIRRDLHRHPELSYREQRTTDLQATTAAKIQYRTGKERVLTRDIAAYSVRVRALDRRVQSLASRRLTCFSAA